MQRLVAVVVAALGVAVVGGFLFLRSPRPARQPAESSAPIARTPPAPPRTEPAPPPASRSPVPVRRSPRPAPSPAPPVASAPSADIATLRITSDVPGAQVFIDRQFVGAAPLTVENIKPGIHQLNASVEGFDGVAETIDVAPGSRDIAVRFREVRLDAKLAVVHKHRLGSCAGQLSATPRELRYDTSNKDDAFTAAMADVESIDVDYLQKNLRVKLRKGKTYNFTDPQGNADRLFVFQRDVEKARQRLAKGDQPAGN